MTDNPEQVYSNNTRMSWKMLGLKVIGFYILYILLAHIIDPVNTPPSSWSSDKVIFYYLFSYVFHFSVIFVFISILFLVSKFSSHYRNTPTANLLNKSLVTSFIVSIFLLYGGWNATRNGDNNQAMQAEVNNKRHTSERKPVIAAITIQNSEGITEDNLDQTALNNIEAWLIQTIKQKGQNNYSSSGHDPKNYKPTIYANSVYINIEDKKLAVTKINLENTVRSVFIMGFQGHEFLRVSCFRNSDHDIPIFSGECGRKINEAFNIKLKP